MTVLAVKGLTYSFGKQTVLDNISFTLEKGDIAGLIGNNGAGKTTLMKLVSGILAGPKDIIDLKTKTVGALIEAPALYPNMTVEANLKFYCKLYSKDYALIDRYKDELEVAAYFRRKASKLSLGMKQRVGLFIALIASDELILLDEPTNGLDPNGINSLLTLIKKLAKNHGLTFIISSHILSNLEQVCTKNYLLKNHKLIYLDDSDNVKYKIYTEDLSLKSLMSLLKLNGLSFERQNHDILVKGLAAVKQVMDREGIPFYSMKSKLRTVFLKQECVTRSVFICLGLVALIGAIVILCDGYKGDYLGPSAIVASYSFIVDIVFAYLAVSSLGREFQNRTINMIRVSSLSGREVILRKLLSFLVLSIVAATILVLELAFYKYSVQHVDFPLWDYIRNIYIDFLLYGAFIYMVSSLLVLFVKNTLTAFVTAYFGVTGMTFFTLYLASLGDTMTKLMTYVPFSFMRAVFTSGQQFFSLREALVLFAWTLVLLLFAPTIYEKRAFV